MAEQLFASFADPRARVSPLSTRRVPMAGEMCTRCIDSQFC